MWPCAVLAVLDGAVVVLALLGAMFSFKAMARPRPPGCVQQLDQSCPITTIATHITVYDCITITTACSECVHDVVIT